MHGVHPFFGGEPHYTEIADRMSQDGVPDFGELSRAASACGRLVTPYIGELHLVGCDKAGFAATGTPSFVDIRPKKWMHPSRTFERVPAVC